MIQITQTEGRHELIINRPERRNALTDAMYRQLDCALQAAQADPACHAVILSGSGGHFTAGNDLAEFQIPQDTSDIASIAFLHTLASIDVPVIAAVEGQAVGVGVTLLQHCDFVYADESARFWLPFVSLGLCPEGASSLLLSRIAGSRRAAQWLLGATPFGAAEAFDGQLLTAISATGDTLADARLCAQRLATHPVQALRLSKRMMRDPDRAEVARVLDAERDQFLARLHSAEAQAAFQKFFARKHSS